MDKTTGVPSKNWVTHLCLIVCGVLFFTEQLLFVWNESLKVPHKSWMIMDPIRRALIYDVPTPLDQWIEWLDAHPEASAAAESQKQREIIAHAEGTPVWPGLYSLVLLEWTHPQQGNEPLFPLMEKIRAGQWWRLFSPAFLHAGILHLLFNMMWLLLLGREIETHISSVRLILLILIVGGISNTAQYLMSGFNFMGFSGILCGMMAFIWMRTRQAPWEYRTLNPSLARFMFLFVLGFFLLQVFIFFLFILSGYLIDLPFANTGHIVGAFVGLCLGRFSLFRLRLYNERT